MIINEKRLCRLLKQKYKYIGYKIVQEGDHTILNADGIVVRMESAFVPRQLLGLLVEHSGDIPADCSIQVMSGRFGYSPGASNQSRTHRYNPEWISGGISMQGQAIVWNPFRAPGITRIQRKRRN